MSAFSQKLGDTPGAAASQPYGDLLESISLQHTAPLLDLDESLDWGFFDVQNVPCSQSEFSPMHHAGVQSVFDLNFDVTAANDDIVAPITESSLGFDISAGATDS
ncbi:hypothetical protein OPT61_g10319 [Boeremia exigua]|uniref:Uncharacterized protein n=1 Tax=Boeremia exigua TaxID=749465 RepID=A0ACC2HQA0_9PLEO|nr:hypothetical protein OPT61_g10319 [Boeremia exigua]